MKKWIVETCPLWAMVVISIPMVYWLIGSPKILPVYLTDTTVSWISLGLGLLALLIAIPASYMASILSDIRTIQVEMKYSIGGYLCACQKYISHVRNEQARQATNYEQVLDSLNREIDVHYYRSAVLLRNYEILILNPWMTPISRWLKGKWQTHNMSFFACRIFYNHIHRQYTQWFGNFLTMSDESKFSVNGHKPSWLRKKYQISILLLTYLLTEWRQSESVATWTNEVWTYTRNNEVVPRWRLIDVPQVEMDKLKLPQQSDRLLRKMINRNEKYSGDFETISFIKAELWSGTHAHSI